MAERKVEVEINGKKLRVAEHMVPDIMKFGATLTKREIKTPPKELQMPLPKKVVIPAKESIPDPNEIPQEVKEPPSEAVVPSKIVKPRRKKNG